MVTASKGWTTSTVASPKKKAAVVPAPAAPANSQLVAPGTFDAFFKSMDQVQAAPQDQKIGLVQKYADNPTVALPPQNPEQQALDNLGLGGAQPPPAQQVGQPASAAGATATPPGPVAAPPASSQDQVPPLPPPPAPASAPQLAVGTDLGAGGTYMGAAPSQQPPPPAPAAFSNGAAQSQGAVQANTPLNLQASQVTSTSAPVASQFNAGTNMALQLARNAPAMGGGQYADAQGQAVAALLEQQAAQSQTQQALVQRLGQEAERAGIDAAGNLALPKFQQPSVRTAFGTTAVAPRTQSSIQQALEQRILASLQGQGEDPQTALLRAQYEEDAKATERQTIEDLQRYGVLMGGGDTADVLGKLRGEQDNGRLQLGAYSYQNQQRALDQAMAYQQSQDALGLDEANMVGNLRGTATMEAQRAQADVGLELAGLDQANRQYEGNYNLQRLGMQQEVADRTLARGLTQTSPTQREIFGEGQRGALTAEDLARRSLAQEGQQFTQGQQLERELAAGQVSLGANRAPTSTLAAQQLGLQKGQLLGSIDGQQTLDARNSGVANALATAELYGTGPGGQQTLGSRALAQEGQLQGRQLSLAELAQQQGNSLATAELYGVGPNGQRTLGSQALTQEGQLQGRQLSQGDRALDLEALAGNRANALATSELYGVGPGGQRTLGAQDLDLRRSGQLNANELAQAELTGQYRGADTLGARALTGDQAARDRQLGQQDRSLSLDEQQRADQVNQERLQRDTSTRLATADLLGYYTDPTSGSRTQTVQGRQQMTAEELAQAELTGQYRGQDTLGRRQLNQQGSQFDRSLALDQGGQDLQREAMELDNAAQNRQLTLAEQTRRDQVNQEMFQRNQNASQFDRSLAQSGTQQNFANELAQAELYGSGADGRQTMTAAQFERQNKLDSLAQLISAKQAGYDVGGTDISKELLDRLGFESQEATPETVKEDVSPLVKEFKPSGNVQDVSPADIQARLASGEYYTSEDASGLSMNIYDKKTGQLIGSMRG